MGFNIQMKICSKTFFLYRNVLYRNVQKCSVSADRRIEKHVSIIIYINHFGYWFVYSLLKISLMFLHAAWTLEQRCWIQNTIICGVSEGFKNIYINWSTINKILLNCGNKLGTNVCLPNKAIKIISTILSLRMGSALNCLVCFWYRVLFLAEPLRFVARYTAHTVTYKAQIILPVNWIYRLWLHCP